MKEVREVRFIVMGEPQGKGRPRFSGRIANVNGKQKVIAKARTPDNTVMYENLIKTEYGIQTNNFKFGEGVMLDMRIYAYYSIPKSKPKNKREMMIKGVLRPTKKPDMDNIMKVVADSLNKIAYRDDSQIVDSQCRKFYSEQPRIEVLIRQIGQDL